MTGKVQIENFAVNPTSNSLKRISGLLRSRELSLNSYLESLQKRFEVVEPFIKSFVEETNRFERLRNQIVEIELCYKQDKPLLFGVPIGIKDIFYVDGFKTFAGSKLPPDVFTGNEGEVVKTLKKAGSLILGKTVTTEFAYFAPGPTRNPHNLNFTPGGSSSGSASAVSAGLTPLAIGTQTIGSIIRPAAFCGVVGFKPSQSRIPVDGIVHLAPSIDQIGFFTSDVESAELVASILCRKWKAIQNSTLIKLCVPEGTYLQKVKGETLEYFRKFCGVLQSKGFEIINLQILNNFDEIVKKHYNLVSAEAAMVHRNWFQKYSHLYHQKTIELIERGKDISEIELEKCRNSCSELRFELTEIMEKHHISAFILPSTIGPANYGIESTGDPIMNLPWTHAGLPVINVPYGFSREGLPLGLQVVGRYWEDEELVKIATVIESNLPQNMCDKKS